MALVKEPITPSLIANTSMVKGILNGVHETYEITPNENYVLHDKGMDEEVFDPNTLQPTGEIKLGFRRSTATCAANYDFATNPREFYAVLFAKRREKECSKSHLTQDTDLIPQVSGV